MTEMIKEPRSGARHRLAVLLVTSVVALAGCSGPAAGGLMGSGSPLSRYLAGIPAAGQEGFPTGGSEAEQQAFTEQQLRQTEDLVAQCMAKVGFEYTPDTMRVVTVIGEGDELWKPDERNWVAQYGYGLIQSPGQHLEPPPSQTATDPNATYLASLSDAEREAYNDALFGTGTPPTGDEEYEYRWQDSGCRGWAEHEMDARSFWRSAEFQQLIDAIDRFQQTWPLDPRIADIDADWVVCMDAAGHGGFSKQSDGEESIQTLIDSYYQNESADVSSEDVGTLADPAYAEIADAEVSLALVDLTCRESTHYAQRRLEVQYALEEQFIADHKAELDAALAQFGRAG